MKTASTGESVLRRQATVTEFLSFCYYTKGLQAYHNPRIRHGTRSEPFHLRAERRAS